MKRWAVASLGLLVACGGKIAATSPADGSLAPPDALDDAGQAASEESAPRADGSSGRDASGDASVASAEAGAAGDAGQVGEAGQARIPPECANETVPPSTLVCTGLYADIATKTTAPDVQFYTPAVLLWSDNADKKRWIQFPTGTKIDASNPSEWTFPVGTKVWKEFSKNGQRVETRLFQKVDNGPPPFWVHATYAWNADESAAISSPGGDIVLGADGGAYHIPTFGECEKCHNGRTDHLLGFEQALLGMQGAQGLTLSELAKQNLIAPVPAQLQPTIGDDGTGAAAPALAWLHVNCGVSCHNGNSNSTAFSAGMLLRLDPTLLDGRPTTGFAPLTTTIGVPANTPQWTQPTHWTRIVPGDLDNSLLFQLIAHRGSNNPAKGQMPPIATSIVDTDDVAKVAEWISKMSGGQTIDGGSDAGIGGADATVGVGGD